MIEELVAFYSLTTVVVFIYSTTFCLSVAVSIFRRWRAFAIGIIIIITPTISNASLQGRKRCTRRNEAVYKYALIFSSKRVSNRKRLLESTLKVNRFPAACFYTFIVYVSLAFSHKVRLPSSLPRTRLKFGERAFSIAAANAWKNLPLHVRTADKTDTFKRNLKLFYSVHFISYRALVILRIICQTVQPQRRCTYLVRSL